MNNLENDKSQIILALTIIALVSMIVFQKDSLNLINSIVAGLLGLAIGQKIR